MTEYDDRLKRTISAMITTEDTYDIALGYGETHDDALGDALADAPHWIDDDTPPDEQEYGDLIDMYSAVLRAEGDAEQLVILEYDQERYKRRRMTEGRTTTVRM